MMLFLILFPFRLVENFLYKSIRFNVFLAVVFVVCQRYGIITRLIQLWIEHEAQKVLNAPLTMSNFEYKLLDLKSLQSTIIMYDCILHTPQIDEWKWDSPIIGRVGYLKCSFNIMSLLELPSWVKSLFNIHMNPIKDIYSIDANDIQVFVEKRRNVFNFHLLDASLDIPSPKEVLESISMQSSVNALGSVANSSGINASVSSKPIVHEGADEKKAKEFILGIVDAVESLGRAANEGGTLALSTALRNQKEGLVTQLKKVQNMVEISNDNKSIQEKTTSIGIAKEGLHVMKHVGKVVEKNVMNMKEQVDALSKPPPKKSDWKIPIHPDLFRFGYISIEDILIFTKDILVVKSSSRTPGISDIATEADKTLTCSSSDWSKPIRLDKVYLPSQDLSPSSADHESIGQPIEVILDVVLEKIFNELTKSATGKLLSNVFSDVFLFFNLDETRKLN